MVSGTTPSFYIIGGGRTGSSLTFYFLQHGFNITALVERNPRRLKFLRTEMQWDFITSKITAERINSSDIILLAIQDDHIPDMAETLSRMNIEWRNKIVLHCSGTLSSGVLQPVLLAGAKVASFHPIFSFSRDPRENRNLNDIWFDGEGDSEAIKSLSSVWGPKKEFKFIKVTPAQKTALHLATVFYSNFYIALAQMSKELLNGIEISYKDTFRILNPLLSSSVHQVLDHGPSAALTGPVRRADEGTIVTHLHYLKNHHPELLEIYRQLSLKLLAISGLTRKKRDRLESILQQFQQ